MFMMRYSYWKICILIFHNTYAYSSRYKAYSHLELWISLHCVSIYTRWTANIFVGTVSACFFMRRYQDLNYSKWLLLVPIAAASFCLLFKMARTLPFSWVYCQSVLSRKNNPSYTDVPALECWGILGSIQIVIIFDTMIKNPWPKFVRGKWKNCDWGT